MFGQGARRVVVAQRPAVAAEDEVGATTMAFLHRVREAHHFEWHLLFGSTGRLLPLERDQYALALFRRDSVHLVRAATTSIPDPNLRLTGISATSQRGQDHRFEDASGGR